MNDLKILENDNLVPVYVTSTGDHVVYGSDLHKVLEVKSKFADWIKLRFADVEAVKDADYTVFSKILEKGRPQKDFIIKLDTAKEMAMLERNAKGKSVRRYFIDIEKRYKQELPSNDTERLDQHIITLAQGHVALRNDVNTLKQEMHDLKDDLPIFPAEAEKITLAVKRKGVEVMGGKKSPAYRDRSLVQSIYHDIYGEIHRQFGITSYKMLRRKDVDSAVSVVSEYSLPIILVERVKDANAQTSF